MPYRILAALITAISVFTMTSANGQTTPVPKPNTYLPNNEYYPPEDLPVYRMALNVKDLGVRRNAIQALKHYDEGLILLGDVVLTATNRSTALIATECLRGFVKLPDYETTLLRIRKTLGQKDKPASRDQYQDLILQDLTRQLFAFKPKTYADEMPAILEKLLSGDNFGSYSYDWNKELETLAGVLPKTKLYPLIPLLIDKLAADSFGNKLPIYKNIALITGTSFEAYEKDPRKETKAAVEFYRELYYSKLKSKIKK